MFEIITFIVILSFLVIIHELGHFFAARWAKIKIDEFGLGYPPKALKLFEYKGTPFTLNWIPFGGFVKMEGEDGPVEQKKSPGSGPFPFNTRSAFQRLVVILAGVTANFVFGIIAFSIVYTVLGIPTLIDQARIKTVVAESPAAEASLPTNVNIIAFRHQEEVTSTTTNQQVIDFVKAHPGETTTLITTGPCDGQACAESAQEFEVYLRTSEETPAGQGSLGISFESQVFMKFPWYEQLARGVLVGLEQAVFLGLIIIQSLASIIMDLVKLGSVPAELAGPVGIVHQAQQEGIFSQGSMMILNFAGLLSINLAIMNLLPIPALDGGRALFIALEKIVGRKKIEKIEGYANYGGFIILIGLIIMITARDLWRLFV
jgi:regulator of sigma E protease